MMGRGKNPPLSLHNPRTVASSPTTFLLQRCFSKGVEIQFFSFSFFRFTALFPFKQRIALALLYLGYPGQICVSVCGLTTASAETALIFIMSKEP